MCYIIKLSKILGGVKMFNAGKFKRLASFLKKFLTLIYWLYFIATILVGISLVIGLFIPKDKFNVHPFSSSSVKFSIDNLTFIANSMANEIINIKLLLGLLLILIFVVAIITILVIRQIIKILKTVEEENPFDIENSKRLSFIGKILIISSFIVKPLQSILATYFIEIFKIENISARIKIDLTLLFIGLFIILLAKIFSYGNYLQQEYDSTV